MLKHITLRQMTNAFGNINIEMARMSGYEFIKRLNRSYRDEILSGEPEDDNLNYGNYNGTSTGLPNVIKGNTPTGKLVYPTMSKPATGYTTNTIGKAFKSLKTKDALKAYKKSKKSKKS